MKDVVGFMAVVARTVHRSLNPFVERGVYDNCGRSEVAGRVGAGNG